MRLGEFDRVRHGAATQTTITPAAPPTDAELIDGYAADQLRRGLAESTIEKRSNALTTLARDYPLLTITRDELILVMDGMDVTPASMNSWTSTIKLFFDWANMFGHTDRHPASALAKAKVGRRQPRPIHRDDLTKALDLATPIMRAWLSCAAFAGLRAAEIAQMEAEQIRDDTIRFIGKGNAERIVPLHSAIIEALEPLNLPTSGRLWLNPRGTPWTPERLSGEVGQYFRILGMKWTTHSLRHYFATALVKQETHLSVVQQLMGHASPETTMRYVRVDQSKLTAAVSTLDAL